MFSQELEEIIDAALADGEITEKERAVLHKRAIAEGVDPDELDVVIDGRLVKMKKGEKDWLRPASPPTATEKPKDNSKFGHVNKCPNCGAVVEAATVKCAECGYEFRGIEGNSSVQKLSKQIQEANEKYPPNALAEVFGMSTRISVITGIISNFPIPTTKEDLLEFILFLEPKTKRGGVYTSSTTDEIRFAGAYKAKYKECINKVQVFFPNDPLFENILPKKSGLFGGLFGKK